MNLAHVPRRWLQLLHIFYLVVDVLLLSAIIAAQGHNHAISQWGLDYTTAMVVGAHLVYGLVFYPLLQKRHVWIATIISQGLFNLIFAALIQDSNYHSVVYRLGWVITIVLSATLGIYVTVAQVCIDAVMNVLSIISNTTFTSNNPTTAWILTAGVVVAGLVGWLLFRRFYETDSSNPGLDQLNRHLAQAQLQSNVIFQSITDGVVVFDVTGKITAMNPAAAALTGWNVKDAVGLDTHLVLKLAQEDGKPLDANQDVFMEALHSQQHVTQTVLLAGQKDTHTVISLVISPIVVPPNDVAGAVAVFRDITVEHKEQQQRADFISTASHEMRTPVAAIEGYLSLALNSKVSTVDAKARDFLEKAHESTQHLGQLFQDLLTSAKAEDGRLSNHPQVVEMGAFAEKLTNDLRFSAQKKQLGMEFLVGRNEVIDARQSDSKGKNVVRPLYYVYVDPDRVREVITNLFDNAVKYTDAGKISVGLTGDPQVVQLYIHDTGAGIPAEDVPHLFQKFYRVDSSATRTIGGTGLGLFISRKIIELYHGRIWVESKVGEGSTFYINLPRLTAEKATQLQAAEASTAPAPIMTT